MERDRIELLLFSYSFLLPLLLRLATLLSISVTFIPVTHQRAVLTSPFAFAFRSSPLSTLRAMTRPLPHGIKRIRRYKSCAKCRDAKGKCTGLDEDYLRALDDPNYVHPTRDLPKCTRCKRLGAECTFNPSRRKGRPRRILRNQKGTSETPSQSRSPSASASPGPSSSKRNSHIPSPTPSDYDSVSPPGSPVFAAAQFDYPHGRSSPEFTLPSPPEPTQPLTPPQDVYLLPPIDHDVDSHSNELPPILPNPPRNLLPPQGIDLEWIADSYLQEIFAFCPLLPPEPTKLKYHLATCDPLLLASIGCILDPSLAAPAFPSLAPRISLSTFQASVFFALQAYGVGLFPSVSPMFDSDTHSHRLFAGEGSYSLY